jgi:hypothetical protein
MTIPASQRAACHAHQARAHERAKESGAYRKLQATGITSLNGIAAALNIRRIRAVAVEVADARPTTSSRCRRRPR